MLRALSYGSSIPWPNVLHPEVNEQEEDGDGNARNATKKDAPSPEPKQADVGEVGANTGAPERSDSDESDDSM